MKTTELNSIQFYPELLHLLESSTSAALMLSIGIAKQRDLPAKKFWPYDKEQWELTTGMSRRVQDSTRKILNKHDFWRERVWGYPATNEFRIDFSLLDEALENINPENN